MPAELSDYEKQRQRNIAANESVLALLGLANGASKLKQPPPPKKRRDDEDSGEPRLPTRKSARVSNAPITYSELSDEFCLREEKQLERMERASTRPQRLRTAPSFHSDEQAEAIRKQEELNAKKRQKAKLDAEYAHKQHIAMQAAAYAANPVLPNMTVRFMPQEVTTQNAQKKGKCWRCGQHWSLRKDGTIRDHGCTPLVGVAQPITAPHLPVM